MRAGQLGSLSQAKHTNHLPVALRVIVQVLTTPLKGRCCTSLICPNLGEGELALLIDAKSRLRVGEAVVPHWGLVARHYQAAHLSCTS